MDTERNHYLNIKLNGKSGVFDEGKIAIVSLNLGESQLKSIMTSIKGLRNWNQSLFKEKWWKWKHEITDKSLKR